MVGNLIIKISHVHVRYEGDYNQPEHPFALGLTLESIMATTVDEEGNETFCTSQVRAGRT